jgi:uncharacterized protein (TIGR02231 family)
VLSNAQPMLNAAPPELVALKVDVRSAHEAADQKAPFANLEQQQRALAERQQGQQAFNREDMKGGNFAYNSAAARVQQMELIASDDAAASAPASAGATVSYHLSTRHTIPSRNDQQFVEIARVELAPDFYYKTIPVLTPHVYRLATFTNTTEMVLLPGRATMYLGGDFVGHTALPLAAIGEQFTVGFGVDAQVQVTRQLVRRTQNVQGGNQVHHYDYQIRINSYKQEEMRVQLWDRLPKGEADTVGVNLTRVEPALSTDAAYLRTERPDNLLRWDLVVPAGANVEKAAEVSYQFEMEYDRKLALAGATAEQ